MMEDYQREITFIKDDILNNIQERLNSNNVAFEDKLNIMNEKIDDNFGKIYNMLEEIMGTRTKRLTSRSPPEKISDQHTPMDRSSGNSPVGSDSGDLDITNVFGIEQTRRGNSSGRRTVFPETKNSAISTTYYQQVEPFSCKLASSYYSVARSFFNAAYIHAEMHNSSVPFVQANMSSEVQAAVMSHAKIDAQQFAVLSLQSVMRLTLRYMAPTTAKQYVQALRSTVAQVMNIQTPKVVPSVSSTNFKRLMDEAIIVALS